ncbi:MAG TPA: FAD-dependent oxidoreductase [Actinomycetes bacterium]
MTQPNGQPPTLHRPGLDGRLPVAVIGAGPVGLAAAAHLLQRGLDPLVLEAGEVGAGVQGWAHVRVFSPWQHNLDAAATRLLTRSRWVPPDPGGYPTGAELRERYLLPLAATPELAPRLRLGTRVLAITRHGRDKMKDGGREQAPFEVVVESGGRQERLLAGAVVDAGGTVGTPNPLGASGIPAPGEAALAADGCLAYGVADVLAQPGRYAGRRVLVVGSGHSAMQVLGDLVRLREQAPGTEVTWAVRRAQTAGVYRVDGDDPLPARAALGAGVERLVAAGAVRLVTGVEVEELRPIADGILVAHPGGLLGPVDQVVAATGFRPDLAALGELRLGLDPAVEAPAALAPLIDPNTHSCNTVPPHGALELAHPEPGFYLAGMKSYGRAPTFLMLTGYEQVRSIAAALAGDLEAARRVELTLPAGGACSTDRGAADASCTVGEPAGAGAAACCGPEVVPLGERPAGTAMAR